VGFCRCSSRFPPSRLIALHLSRALSRALICGVRLCGKYVGRVKPPNVPSVIHLSVVAVVLIVRTYAVWNRDKRIGIGLALLFILCQTATGIITGKWIGAANCGCCVASLLFSIMCLRLRVLAELFLLAVWNPYPEVYLGCIYNRGTRLVFANWVILSIEEGGTLRPYSRRLRLIGAGTMQLILY